MNHQLYMQMALDLAFKGAGHVSPNPMVGAVLVRDEKIIGTGFHQKYGSAHAEVNAILDARARGEKIEGSTLYCNLEPCSHTNKQTPPCAPLVCEEKIARVVIANIDPNPLVSGGGVQLLKSHGVEVITGVLEEEGRKLNEAFFKFISTKTPFVHLKLAQTLDGRIATKTGESKYITGPEARAYVHRLRQQYDCLMVGRKTIEADNPDLTTRSEEFEKISHPLRLILGSLSRISKDWKIVTDEFKRNTMFVSTDEDIKNNQDVAFFLEKNGIALLSTGKDEKGNIDLRSMLKSLGSLKMTSILLEGGPTLATEFLKQGLVDKVSIIIAPVILGEGKNAVADLGIEKLSDKLKLSRTTTSVLGKDILIEGYLCSQD